MYKNKKIALVIPAYNEQKLIIPTLEGAPEEIDHIYVIDDVSTDNTAKVVKEHKDSRVELIQHQRNTGPGGAIITGYKKAAKDDYDVVVVVGGDNQMDLSEVKNLLEPIIKNEADYVKGNRFMGPGSAFKVMPKKRFFGNSVLSFLTRICSGYWQIFDTQEGYTAITKQAIQKINWDEVWKKYGYPSDFLIVFNTYNLRVKDVPRTAIYTQGERQSQIKISKYIMKMLPLFLRRFFWRLKRKYIFQQFHPLVFFYLMSFVLIPLGMLMGIWILAHIRGAISVNQVVLCALFIITGFQSFLFAMLFDMQANTHLQNIEK